MLFFPLCVKIATYQQPYIQLGFFFLIRPLTAFSKQV